MNPLQLIEVALGAAIMFLAHELVWDGWGIFAANGDAIAEGMFGRIVEGGTLAGLVAFLLWMQIRERSQIQTEAAAREARMAERIDKLETQHHDTLGEVVCKSSATLARVEDLLGKFAEARPCLLGNQVDLKDAIREALDADK